MKCVYVASPYREREGGPSWDVLDAYLCRALRNSLARGEAPYASHRMYPGVLNDDDPAERDLGMRAGLAFIAACDVIAVYADHGVSDGMRAEIDAARLAMLPVHWRYIEEDRWTDDAPLPT